MKISNFVRMQWNFHAWNAYLLPTTTIHNATSTMTLGKLFRMTLNFTWSEIKDHTGLTYSSSRQRVLCLFSDLCVLLNFNSKNALTFDKVRENFWDRHILSKVIPNKREFAWRRQFKDLLGFFWRVTVAERLRILTLVYIGANSKYWVWHSVFVSMLKTNFSICPLVCTRFLHLAIFDWCISLWVAIKMEKGVFQMFPVKWHTVCCAFAKF